MSAVQTSTLRTRDVDAFEFANEVSRRVLNGWTVISSGFDGSAMMWWAIFQKHEQGGYDR